MGRPSLLLLSLLLPTTALAQGPVLHEYVPDVKPNEAALMLAAASEGGASFEYDGELIDAPGDSQFDLSQPAMTAAPGDGQSAEDAGKRSPSFRPDRVTDLEERLDYYASFTPAIAPFKRVNSMDAVVLATDGHTPVLVVSDDRSRPVAVEGEQAPLPDRRPRDRFWGDVVLDFAQGARVPLPSVAPDARILSLRSDPPTPLRIERDRADNFYARLTGPASRPRVRLTFLMDAPRIYFGTPIPQLPSDRLSARVPPLARSIRRRGLAFARELGLQRGQDLRLVLHRLVEHFRSFEESAEPPRDSGDIYLDLARDKKGICRHRSYAFVVTAQALGIPTRFVQNEAHSWVEVELPDRGWMRIDLGGSADGMNAHGAAERPIYRPAQPDALPRPRAYAESYSLLGRSVSGLRAPRDEELTGRWIPPAPAERSVEAEPGRVLQGGPSSGAAPVPGPGDGRAALRLRVDQQRVSVLRGRELQLTGRVQRAAADGAGVPALRIEVSLAAPDRRERMLLGVTVSDEEGRFAGAFGIPPDLSVGDYQLVVIAPGNADYAPAMAR